MWKPYRSCADLWALGWDHGLARGDGPPTVVTQLYNQVFMLTSHHVGCWTLHCANNDLEFGWSRLKDRLINCRVFGGFVWPGPVYYALCEHHATQESRLVNNLGCDLHFDMALVLPKDTGWMKPCVTLFTVKLIKVKATEHFYSHIYVAGRSAVYIQF